MQVGGAHGEEDLDGVVAADGEEIDAVVVVACADDVDVGAVCVADVHGGGGREREAEDA